MQLLALLLVACAKPEIRLGYCTEEVSNDVTSLGATDLAAVMPNGSFNETADANGADGPLDVTFTMQVAGTVTGVRRTECRGGPEAEGDFLVVPVQWHLESSDGYTDLTLEGEAEFRGTEVWFQTEVSANRINHPFSSGDDPRSIRVSFRRIEDQAFVFVEECYEGPLACVVLYSSTDADYWSDDP